MKKCLVIRVPSEKGWTNCRIESDSSGMYMPVDEHSIRVCPFPHLFEVEERFPNTVNNGDRYFEVTVESDKWED